MTMPYMLSILDPMANYISILGMKAMRLRINMEIL